MGGVRRDSASQSAGSFLIGGKASRVIVDWIFDYLYPHCRFAIFQPHYAGKCAFAVRSRHAVGESGRSAVVQANRCCGGGSSEVVGSAGRITSMTVIAAGTIADFFRGQEFGELASLVLAAVVHAVFLITMFGVAPVVFIWLERKASGRIQDRLGPTRVGGRFGWLQSIADGAKLVQKEDLVPSAADSMLFRVAPYIVCISAFAAFMLLPFSDGWVAVAADCGLFVMLAIMSLEVFGIILAGWSSGSKWSLFGGMREAAQMVSYEIPMALCALIPIVTAGTLNLVEIGAIQTGPSFGGVFTLQHWLVFHDPFTFVAFFVYFTVATASCKRAPFDLAEAESELVGGFHTEYSGMRWSFFFLGEYAAMFAVSGIAAILFLGGWHTGLAPVDGWLNAQRALGGSGFNWLTYLANLVGMVVFIGKASTLVFVQIWLRWTLPRLRIDQVMTTCLKYLIPISCVLLLGVTLWPFVVLTVTSRSAGDASVYSGRTTLAADESLAAAIGNQVPARKSVEAGPVPAGADAVNGSASVDVGDGHDVPAAGSETDVHGGGRS